MVFKFRRRVRPIVSHKNDLHLVRKVHGHKFPKLRQILHIKRILSSKEYSLLILSSIVFVFSLVWAVSVSSGKYRVEIPAVGGTYVEAAIGAPHLINPLFAGLNDVDMDITKMVYSGLMKYDNQRRLVPDIAASYEVSEDKKTYTFQLRQDVFWHDGEKLTSEDIVYTIEALQDDEIGSPLRVSFQGVEVNAFDEFTIQFVLEEPFQSFLSSLVVGILPEHVWGSISPDTIRLAGRNLKPIGSGPYVFSKLVKDDTGLISRFELKRFENYHGQVPFIEKFAFQFFADYEGVGGAIQALREQKVTGLNFIPSSLREKVARKNINMLTLQLPQYSALFFNQDKNELLKKDQFRLALAQVIDKNRLLHESLNNEGAVIHGPILPTFPGYDQNFAPYEYSMETANQALDKLWDRIDSEVYRQELKEKLLEERNGELATSTPQTDQAVEELSEEENKEESEGEAQELGFEEEIDTLLDRQLDESQLFYRKDQEGNIIQLNLVTADIAEYRKASQVIAGAWQELGVSVNIKYVLPKDISKEVLRERDYDVLLYGVIVGSDPDQYPFWSSSQIDYPGLNLSRYVNRGIDDILEKIRNTEDEVELEKLYKEFQEKLVSDLPAVFLYTPTYTYILSDKIKGFSVHNISHPSDRFSNVIEWYIDTKHIWEFNKNK